MRSRNRLMPWLSVEGIDFTRPVPAGISAELMRLVPATR
jgi:hypothetical protein